jgi:CheY-like chemotaxis protein
MVVTRNLGRGVPVTPPPATDLQRVLLIEDDAEIRMIADISLSQVGGFETCLAAGGMEGIALAVEHEPDVVLLDMMMPDMDGMATLRVLKNDPATRHIPVIFMTAKVQQHDLQDYVDAGAIGTIHKPFDPMTLPDEVRAMVFRAEALSPAE